MLTRGQRAKAVIGSHCRLYQDRTSGSYSTRAVRRDSAGGWEEVWRSLESIEFFNPDRIVEYVLLLGNATTAAKVGFYLEQHREALMVEARHITELWENRPRQPHYADRRSGGDGTFVAAWNLVVPTEVVERSWEEMR